MPTALPPCRLIAETISLLMAAGEHHLDDLDGRLVGDAQAVHEIGLDLELLQHVGDLRTAAVHDDRIDAGLLEVDDVLGEGCGEGIIAHGVAAELHHHGLLVVADQMRDGFGKDARLHMSRRGAVGGGIFAGFLGGRRFRFFHSIPQGSSMVGIRGRSKRCSAGLQGFATYSRSRGVLNGIPTQSGGIEPRSEGPQSIEQLTLPCSGAMR